MRSSKHPPRARTTARADAPGRVVRTGRPRGFARTFAVLLAAFTLAACGGPRAAGDDGSPGATPTAEPARPAASTPEAARRVRIVTATPEELTATKTASVSIEASRESQVAAGTSGRVEQVLVRPGTLVQTGTTVIRLDDASLRTQVDNAALAVESARVNLEQARVGTAESLDQLQAQLQTARTQLDLARDRYQEGVALLAAGGISQVDLRSLEAQRDQAESAFLQARDALARNERASQEDLRLLELQLEQARNQLRQARDALDEARIVAPFEGQVADVYVEEGEFVGAGSPAFRLIDQDDRTATFNVSSEDAGLLQEQGLVYIRYGGLDYAAQVTRVTRSAQEPRLVRLSADLYPAERPIPTGAVAQLRYTVPLASGVAVPSAALAAEAGSTFVYTIADGVAERLPVRVVAESGSRAIVEGLPAGTPVISPRPLDVRDGTQVVPVDE